jgi:NADH:ubiquinone oxidoreductase subunit 6 (subunit J)
LREILFFLAAFGAIGGALAVILVRNAFYSVLSLVIHLFALATLFLLLNAEFIAAAQIVVYAGAVMVLYVFVVAYIGGVSEAHPIRGGSPAIPATGAVFAFALLVVVTIAVVGTGLTQIDTEGAEVGPGFGSPGAIGEALLRKFLIPFEGASILLLVAAIGAVILSRKRRGLPDEMGGLGRPAYEASTPGDGGPTTQVIGDPDADATRPAVGTAEGPGDPGPEREPSRS